MPRADLHVHSWHSGTNGDLPFLGSRDCYSQPDEVYRTARARGMDLVTITDHDSIDGCLELLERGAPREQVFISEEITCFWPDAPLEIHIGAYGISEETHRAVQPLRGNVHEALALLRASGAVTILNHPFHFYRGQIDLVSYLSLLSSVDGVEARNGAMLREHNDLALALAHQGSRLAAVGGSDAHSLRRVGRTWTEAPGRTAPEFLDSLRAGLARPGGAHGSAASLTLDIYIGIGWYWRALAGLDRATLPAGRRAFGIAFSAASLPAQFLPATVAVVQKRRERRAVERFARALGLGDSAVPALGWTREAE